MTVFGSMQGERESLFLQFRLEFQFLEVRLLNVNDPVEAHYCEGIRT